jgi:hypothetical protein
MDLNKESENLENKKNLEDDNLSDYSSETSEDEESSDEELSSDEESDNIKEINENEPVKKKRGRKCKPKDINLEVEKVQKKRGRKPKVKIIDENEKIPKKRGRKPKEKVYSVKELPKTFFEENKSEALILHLPITPIDKIDNNPLPNLLNSSNNISYSVYNNNVNNYNLDQNNLLPTQMNLMNNSELHNNGDINYSLLNISTNTNVLNNRSINNDIFNNNEISSNNFYEYKKIEALEIKKDNKDYDQDDEFKTNRIIKKNLKNIMYEFINANNDKEWPEKTNIYCWWCCHPFTWMPCALPEYYKKEKFYVTGCFCTFNCASSYNFSKNDDDIWERYSLLNLMYKKLYNEKFVKISLAPPREILQIFGGYMSIDEFRDNSLRNEKTFMVIKPPLISIIPKIEENIANISKNIKNNSQIVNENILSKTQNTLKLKRTKPITNPNSTLQSFMDLKII